MGLVSTFKSFGHAIAAGAKYFESHLIPEAVKIANKAVELEPEVNAVFQALALPQAAAINDLACNVLGRVAQALEPLGADALTAVSANGLNIPADSQLINDVKQFSALIKQLLATRGTPAPAAK